MFVTTADPVLEPPIITVNTVLSLLAVDYPAQKLACYVSDDACSPLTFYALLQASSFAKLWLPFCNKYNIQLRAPFRYFSTSPSSSQTSSSSHFRQEWINIKHAYEELEQKIKDAATGSFQCDLSEKFASAFSSIDRRNHPTIIKVIWENKEAVEDELPHLIYISREKRPKHPHHFKAGAMNVLTRVSGVMTNAPFMLNVDCDMHVNNPQTVLHAMCLLMGVNNERDSAFAQSPQSFYDGLPHDPFGNQLVVLFEFLGRGIVGIQGPLYAGTGCFHRRKVIYGSSPDDQRETNGELSDEDLRKNFGNSETFIKYAGEILSNEETSSPHSLLSSVEAAFNVASCVYEYGTGWGRKVGWMYGSLTEDVLTGLSIHEKGWRSTYCNPNPPAFLGCAPSSGPVSLIQQKRWASGLLDILISRKSPLIATLYGKLLIRQCLAYLWILTWGLRPIPEICYALLPAYCILTNSHFLPKVEEPAMFIPAAIFITYNLYTLSEYIRTGLSTRAWWNNQRMNRVTSMTAWLFAFLSTILNLLGLSEAVFEVTQKEQTANTSDDNNNANAGRFTFDESPIFLPATTVLLLHMTALATRLLGLLLAVFDDGDDEYWSSGLGEMVCSVWVVLCLSAFLKGLFGKGKYGIPSSTICKSVVLAALFVHFCW